MVISETLILVASFLYARTEVASFKVDSALTGIAAKTTERASINAPKIENAFFNFFMM